MLHWIKNFRTNCESCPDLESKITFLEQQLDEYRRRLEEAEKLQAFISSTMTKTEPAVNTLFKQIGAVREAAQSIWTAANEVNVAVSRIQNAQRVSAEQITQS